MVTFPPGDEQSVCAICGNRFEQYDSDFAANYVNHVCDTCDERAVTKHGSEEITRPASETGGNPVYIDNNKCWRRYRFGGHITRPDEYDCETIDEFYEQHREDLVD